MIPPDPPLEERLDSRNHTSPTNRSLSSMFKGWGKKAGSTMGDAYRFITETPARIILTAGTVLSLFTGMGVSKIMDYKSTHRPIHFTPYSAQGESEDVMLDISRGLSDLNNRLGLLYVQLAGATKESVPDKASLKEIIEGEIGHDQGIIALINRAQDYMSPFVPQINVLHNAGEQLHSSFSHQSRDEYHTECHTETEEVCTGSGENEVCTNETNVVCTDVYDYTEHYWTFSDAQANSVVRGQFLPALDSLEKHPLKTIDYDRLRRREVPSKDALGREITNNDEYLQQANEWLDKGLAAKQNDLARIDAVANNGSVREMLMDARSPQGFTGLSTYPPSTYVRNYCSGCDEESAPRGYLTLK